MTEILSVQGLCKAYPHFTLKNVSFCLETGKITGFIGRNGAGKTTTLKSLLNMVHPDQGKIRFFDKFLIKSELEIKQNIGFVSGGIDFYPRKKLKVITDVTKRFYPTWDETLYQHYLAFFQLEEQKTPAELSEGMKVKYALALALSHHASLLILDEPTSGLDPVSRDELLDIFFYLAKQEGVTILFSTHITSDLEKCADYILYIKNGEILAQQDLDSFLAGYKVISLDQEPLAGKEENHLIGLKPCRHGFEALIRTVDLPWDGAVVRDADLETIMVHLEKE